MGQPVRSYRSVLYIPGSNARALEKARELPVDAIIFDLEDAVAADQKTNARALLAETLRTRNYRARATLVRVNALDSEWGRDDVAAFVATEIDGVILPKVNSASDIQALADMIPDVAIWAMMESALGVMNAAAIAAHPRVAGFVLGTNDLAKELTCREGADRGPLMTSLQLCLLAARAHGIICVDGVYNAFRDDAGLRAEARQGRDMGFDGKTLIHPAQIAITNEEFSPTDDEIDLANRQIAAYRAAKAAGSGVAVIDGSIVENLHIVTAQATLAKAIAKSGAEI
jgi:(3S)-malyl-CoA thioesterase